MSARRHDREVARLREALVKVVEALDAEGRADSEAYLLALAALHRAGPRPRRCRQCGATFDWPGQEDEHFRNVHKWLPA
jgi:hypothetical protein